jgi:hypothetical protein
MKAVVCACDQTHRSRASPAIFGVLLVAMSEALHGWDHLVVLGALFATAVGLMIAIAPNRRG